MSELPHIHIPTAREVAKEAFKLGRGNTEVFWGNVANMVEVQFPTNFDRTLHEFINEKGYIPFVYQNHRSHPDVFSVLRIIERIRQVCPQLKSAKVPGALSMMTGDQGEDLRESLKDDGLENWLRGHGVDLLGVVRKLDVERYGMERAKIQFMLSLIKDSQEGHIISEFPEATTTGGKIAKDGKPYGLQPFNDEGFMYGFTRRHLKAGRKILFIRAASVGAEQIFDPDIKKIRPSAYVKYMVNRLAHPFIGTPLKLIHTQVDTITSDAVLHYTGSHFSSGPDYVQMGLDHGIWLDPEDEETQFPDKETFYRFMERQLAKVGEIEQDPWDFETELKRPPRIVTPRKIKSPFA